MKKLYATENDIKKQVRDWLDLHGWFNFHVLQGLGCYPGVPDRIAVKDGIVIFIEVKKPGGKPTTAQLKFKARCKAAGGHYIVVHGWEELSDAIIQII